MEITEGKEDYSDDEEYGDDVGGDDEEMPEGYGNGALQRKGGWRDGEEAAQTEEEQDHGHSARRKTTEPAEFISVRFRNMVRLIVSVCVRLIKTHETAIIGVL